MLALTAECGEDRVAAVRCQLLRDDELPCDTRVRDRLAMPISSPPALTTFAPELSDYDQLLEAGA